MAAEGSKLRQAVHKSGLALALASGLVAGTGVQARGATDPVALSELPPAAQQTYQRILNGGPFRYQQDGVVFGNRERLLPRRSRGFYHEYTVRTPGAPNRGARRIVCGGVPPTQPDICYYTADHYSSFSRIVP
ncbi:MAG: ribonuclease N1 [Burkholderiales bacterium]|nr:ribonuclease N1 [Burkholderiales bacterium]MDE2393840.1 ribonuclease N1 [Burkholderiales bacterium]MDE2456643.1 ribonuclease N1 [Burkholderiales bacterium]